MPRVEWKMYQRNKITEDMIEAWWGAYKYSNIGIITEDLIVIDADSSDSVSWVKKNISRSLFRVKTKKGMHFYYSNKNKIKLHSSVSANKKLDIAGRDITNYLQSIFKPEAKIIVAKSHKQKVLEKDTRIP